MLFQIFESELSLAQNLILLFVMLTVVLGSITVHELAHGFVSYMQGDFTAKRAGRLTLNPLKHLDFIGTVCMIFCGFGWAKPVPIDPRYYKNQKRGTAITALAGPLINLLIGVCATVNLSSLVWLWESGLYRSFPLLKNLTQYGYDLIATSAYVILYYNLLFAVFNMLPVPPFDGSRLLFAFLPDRYYFGVMRYEKLIMLVIFFLLWTGIFTGVFEFFVDLIIEIVGSAVIFFIETFVKMVS